MIKRLYIDNFRCMTNLDIGLAPCQLLLGLNGSGKSSVWYIAAMLRDFVVDGLPLRERLARASLTRWDTRPYQTFQIEVPDGERVYSYELRVDYSTRGDLPRVAHEHLDLDGHRLFEFTEGHATLFNDRFSGGAELSLDWTQSGLHLVTPRRDNTLQTRFKALLESVRCVRVNPLKMLARCASDEPTAGHDMSELAAWIRHLAQERLEDMPKFTASLRECIPGFRGINLDKEGGDVRVLRITLDLDAPETGHPASVRLDLDELSDGERTLIALYALLHFGMDEESTLFIDEPDNFLALPEVQPWLLAAADQAEGQNSQLIVIAHHPTIIDYLAHDAGLMFERLETGPTRIRPFSQAERAPLLPSEVVERGWENG